jgi:uncharacterized protein YdeI (YjbR/CyaY-like superfamily)
MNTNVDTYFLEGCGRCKLGGTPACKVNTWKRELELLRSILLGCGVSETSKWGVPCDMYQKNNILLLGAFKEYCALMFFKGALLQDAEGLLTKAGEHAQAGRQLRFTDVNDIVAMEQHIKAYVFEAIELEKAGMKVTFKKITEHPIPEEFQAVLNDSPALKKAFESLTPGRQRAYLIYFAAAKQSQTRISRIEKWLPNILNGKGMND